MSIYKTAKAIGAIKKDDLAPLSTGRPVEVEDVNPWYVLGGAIKWLYRKVVPVPDEIPDEPDMD